MFFQTCSSLLIVTSLEYIMVYSKLYLSVKLFSQIRHESFQWFSCSNPCMWFGEHNWCVPQSILKEHFLQLVTLFPVTTKHQNRRQSLQLHICMCILFKFPSPTQLTVLEMLHVEFQTHLYPSTSIHTTTHTQTHAVCAHVRLLPTDANKCTHAAFLTDLGHWNNSRSMSVVMPTPPLTFALCF